MSKVGILPCGGACNVGMLSIKATVGALGRNPDAGYVCPLGLPLGIPEIVEKARKFDSFIALNGCDKECSSKALQSVGIDPQIKIMITSGYGIKKNNNFAVETKLEEIVSDVVNETCKILVK